MPARALHLEVATRGASHTRSPSPASSRRCTYARHLHVEVAGTTVVGTDDTIILFETSLPPKLYVAPSMVRTDLLQRSDTVTYCNY